jgi:hypothetical protein
VKKIVGVRFHMVQSRKAPLFVREEKTLPSTPEVYRQLNGMPAYFGNPGAILCGALSHVSTHDSFGVAIKQ